MPRKIALGCDHSTYEVREELKRFIEEIGSEFEVVYLGPQNANAVDYPDYAAKLCEAILNKTCELGVLICGTGIGMSLAANKFTGIRAAVCHDHLTAALAREHNDANVLCAGYRIVGMEVMRDMIHTFLTTPFSNDERHARRIGKIDTCASSLHAK